MYEAKSSRYSGIHSIDAKRLQKQVNYHTLKLQKQNYTIVASEIEAQGIDGGCREITVG